MRTADVPIGHYVDSTMKKGILSAIVLNHIKKQKGVYPYALMKHFRSSGHPFLKSMNKNDIYNLFSSLEHYGFVKGKSVLVGGRVQKLYSITAKGNKYASSFARLFAHFIGESKKLVRSEFGE